MDRHALPKMFIVVLAKLYLLGSHPKTPEESPRTWNIATVPRSLSVA